MTHLIKIKGKEVKLSTREAQTLLAELQAVFGPPVPLIIPMPYPSVQPENPFNPPWEITCESRNN